MSVTHPPKAGTAWRAVVTVRVTPSDGADLATSAGRRLEREDDVQDLSVQALQDIEPTLSATVVTVAVTLQTPTALDGDTVADRLTAAPGTEAVEVIEPA